MDPRLTWMVLLYNFQPMTDILFFEEFSFVLQDDCVMCELEWYNYYGSGQDSS